jgi:hypothetical protein
MRLSAFSGVHHFEHGLPLTTHCNIRRMKPDRACSYLFFRSGLFFVPTRLHFFYFSANTASLISFVQTTFMT